MTISVFREQIKSNGYGDLVKQEVVIRFFFVFWIP